MLKEKIKNWIQTQLDKLTLSINADNMFEETKKLERELSRLN